MLPSPIDVRILGTGADLVPFQAAWDLQRQLHTQRVDDEIGDTVLLLEHEPVYTAGRRTLGEERPVNGTPVVDVDRGGKITWHGPGQLVGYPIVRLGMPIDLVKYVRLLESILMAACADIGLSTIRVDGRTGVWMAADPAMGLPERKLAAIGVRVARGVTMHGFALNCNNALGGFEGIVPCGITDASVSTVSQELGRDVSVDTMIGILTDRLREGLATPITRHEAAS